jgi:DNA polymerase-3 subunit alpha
VASIGRKYTKQGQPYAVLRLEDLAGGVGVVTFPSVYEQAASLLEPDRIVLVKGRVDLRGRELQLVAMEIREPDLSSAGVVQVPEAAAEPVVVEVPVAACTPGMLAKLKQTLAAHPGRVPVVVQVVGAQGSTPLHVGDGYRVDGSAGLLSELRVLVGPERVRLEEPAGAPY